MKCGESDKRNEEYSKVFSISEYFFKLAYGNKLFESKKKSGGDGLTIFDVGAHKGESAEFFHELFPNALIYSFEPNDVCAQVIASKKFPNVFVEAKALSDFNGKAEFNVQDISHLSSLHKINRNSLSSLGYAKRENHSSISVEVCRGDTYVRSKKISNIDLLKIDVQANEVNTLAGFSTIFSSIANIIVEVSMYDFYDNRSSIRKIEEVLEDFVLYDILEISKNPKTLGTDWATFVYKNKNLELF